MCFSLKCMGPTSSHFSKFYDIAKLLFIETERSEREQEGLERSPCPGTLEG
jgi:hypothetical protein